MSQNVARSLGYTPERSVDVQSVSVRCPWGCRDGEKAVYVDFPTDDLGRVIERCPSCRRSRLVTPNGDELAQEKRAESLKAARREQEALQQQYRGKDNDGRANKRFPPQQCENVACGQTFAPKSGNQKYCSQACCMVAWKARGGKR